MAKGRIILVSNRLPVSLTHGDNGPELAPSSGGLATALRDVHQDEDSRWIGWVGDLTRATPEQRTKLESQLSERKLSAVPLTQSEVSLYYDGYSNAVLWPLFHYLLDKVRLDASREWRAYQAVNQRFAEAIAKELRPDDMVWVHDYQLMLVPGYLRKLVPSARIGFFLHVPWPASDVFRILSAREEILTGLLGADLIGFHAESYRHNFIHSAAKVLGIDLGIDSVSYGDRTVRLGVFPISIEVQQFARESSEVDRLVAQIRAGTAGKKTLLGVDRLDYTKGVPRRLLAFDRLLEREPALRGKVHFIQLAVPTREKVDSYAELRSNVNELTGRINSQHGSPTGSPIQLLYRSVSADDLLALYRAADVMVVTPLRDGMNLVAKEYVASRVDDAGVLVLSEFAGASAELEAALIVNPYDIAGSATMLRRALFMTEAEQRVRMRKLRAHVESHPVSDWARQFIEELSFAERVSITGFSVNDELNRAVERLRTAPHRTFLFDYDGTLVPLAPLPELAAPDDALFTLLNNLTQLPNTEVHIVSGRSRKSLEEWLGNLPVWLHVEHGFASRDKLGNWREAAKVPGELLARAQEIARVHARRTPGARLEVKAASIAFHYRGADPHLAEARLRVLRSELTSKLGPEIELLEGHKVLEVRLRGVHKGTVLKQIAASVPRESLLFAAGDDRTDEDLFAALPDDAITVRVGPGISRARLRLPGPFELRRLLSSLF